MKLISYICRLVVCSVVLSLFLGGAFLRLPAASQDANGNSPKNVNRPPPGGRPGPRPPCEAAEIIVSCGMPGCNVSLDGAVRGITDDTGQLRLSAAPNTIHSVSATKVNFGAANDKVTLKCGASKIVALTLKRITVTLKVKTNLPGCDIYLNNSPNPVGTTDAQGNLSYQVIPANVLVEARKRGYLSDIKAANLSGAIGEVYLVLTPLPAALNISTNVEGAYARVDQARAVAISRTEKISVTPERHVITVEALGYAPEVFEINPAADEVVTRAVKLKPYTADALLKQAQARYDQRAFADVFTLCNYVFESNKNDPTAHRLVGMAYLSEQNYAVANRHLEQALAGNETIVLRIRRHAGENFELNRGHESCDGVLILNGREVEYRAAHDSGENFKVANDQIEALLPQLKKGVALYLPAKVTVSRGKKRDYNFFAFDKEITSANRPFLELLRLLLSRK